jgi:hypothetical protein
MRTDIINTLMRYSDSLNVLSDGTWVTSAELARQDGKDFCVHFSFFDLTLPQSGPTNPGLDAEPTYPG